jgi:four helix bundle protein
MAKPQDYTGNYDLEERTFQFAKAVRLFVKTLPRTITNIEDGTQLNKASGSVGANYREANEALSKKDFLLRAKISRKEAKESLYGLRLIDETNQLQNADDAKKLIQEATELKKILSSIVVKSEVKKSKNQSDKAQIANKAQIPTANDTNAAAMF